jgi:hypothetical protein
MVSSLQQIAQDPVTVLLYKSGASGEFIGYALTQTIAEFTKTTMTWEDHNRCKFQDYLGRTLTNGDITEDLLCDRVNFYFDSACSIGTKHLALSHFRPEQLEFLKNHVAHWPVIEITTLHPVSERFQRLARSHKIHKQPHYQDTPLKINVTAAEHGFRPRRHLQVEWFDLVLSNCNKTYKSIVEFVEGTGDCRQFETMISDYVQRNQDLIKEAHES